MKRSVLLNGLRVMGVATSLSMMGGYVWFTQRKASATVESPAQALREDEVMRDAVAVEITGADGRPVTVMLSSKNISQPIFSTRDSKSVAEGRAAELVYGPESSQPSTVYRPASSWVLSGSKSFSGATNVVSKQLETLTRTPEPPPIAPGKTPPLELSPKVVMAGSKSGQVSLLEAPHAVAESAAPLRARLDGGHQLQLPQDARPLELRSTMRRNTSAIPDGGGSLAFQSQELTVVPRSASTSVHVFSSSKLGSILPPPPPMMEDVVNGDSKTFHGPLRFLPSLRWDLREAIVELERQIERGLRGASFPGATVLSLPEGSAPKPVLESAL